MRQGIDYDPAFNTMTVRGPDGVFRQGVVGDSGTPDEDPYDSLDETFNQGADQARTGDFVPSWSRRPVSRRPVSRR